MYIFISIGIKDNTKLYLHTCFKKFKQHMNKGERKIEYYFKIIEKLLRKNIAKI